MGGAKSALMALGFRRSILALWGLAVMGATASLADFPTLVAPDVSPYLPLMKKPATIAEAEAQATKLMRAMTPEEKFNFVTGGGLRIKPVERLGIPAIVLNDASGGCHVHENDGPVTSTAFPCTLLLAATWDTDLAHDYAKSIAEEFRMLGMHFILGPGQNMYRNSQCGRSFEYMGEDPYLAAQNIGAYVRGAQSVNVATTLKHYICNETDFHRHAANAVVSDRALHEIYLPPFKAGVDAGSMGVMNSYNLVNGEWTGESHHLITDILRHELGFQFLVMTDWDSTWHGDKLVNAGVDLEMPNGLSLHIDRDKVLGKPGIDRMVVDILKTCIWFGLYDLELKHEFKKPEWAARIPAHEAVARRANEEGIVLLKNNGMLPLDPTAPGKILVTGNFSTLWKLSGNGSGHVDGNNLKSYLLAVQNLYGEDRVEYAENPSDDQIKAAALVLVFTGRPYFKDVFKEDFCPIEGEGFDHPYILPDDKLIAQCVSLNPRTVVNLVCGGGSQMDWADRAGAIVQAFFGGQTGADALTDILTGKVNPSGKLPITIEKNFADSCAADYMKDAKPTDKYTDPVDMGKRVSHNKGCFLSFMTADNNTKVYAYDVNYAEDIFMGYRWYDEKKIEPRFPFGFGLSYTTFGYSGLNLSATQFTKGTPLDVTATITNTGSREGAEVAQLYVSELNPKVPRPVCELKGFQRVSLKPGESKTATFHLGDDAFAYYDADKHAWVTDSGAFSIQVAASSRDIKLKQDITIQ